MIQFNYVNAATGIAVNNALAWVANTNISGNRVTMTSSVQISSPVILPDFTPCIDVQSFSCAYDSNSELSPAAQMYDYLMGLPEFSGGTIYPPA